MIDGNAMAKGHEYFSLSGLNVSPDNKLLAYGIDTISRRKYTLHIKNLETGENLGEAIPNTTGYVAWAKDNNTLFYTIKNIETLRPEKIFIHHLGDSPENDRMVFFEEDEEYTTGVFQSKSR